MNTKCDKNDYCGIIQKMEYFVNKHPSKRCGSYNVSLDLNN